MFFIQNNQWVLQVAINIKSIYKLGAQFNVLKISKKYFKIIIMKIVTFVY
jgi:hypothetical protein